MAFTKFIRVFGVTLAILLLAGCATTEKYRTMVDTWKGQDIESLVNAWGYPDHTMTAPNGNKVYVYERHNVTHFPQYTVGGYTQVSTEGNKTTIVQTPSYVAGGQTYYFDCKTWFEVDKDNKIANVTFRGNDCVMK